MAFASVLAGVYTFVLAHTTEGLTDPGVRAALSVWVFLPYVLAGLIGWWCRPQSRFGPLMVAAGWITFLVMLGWSRNDWLYTLGTVLDLVPPILFLHVFLAFPTGRLQTRFERRMIAAAYTLAVAPSIVRMTLGGLGSHGVLQVASEPGLADAVLKIQLVANAVFALAGIGILVARRLASGPPLRRPLALLVDSFALGLVMIAVLSLDAALEGPELSATRKLTFFVIGLAPIAFLFGLLDARLARSSVGDLLVELRVDPSPADLRNALARALRDPSLTLVYWLPDFRTYVDVDGQPVSLVEEAGRTTTVIERNGSRVAALQHDAALLDEPGLLSAATAAAGIALENARLHAELLARLEELRSSRARVIEAGQSERQRLERNLHDGAQQRLIALSLELSLLEERLDDDPEVAARLAGARAEIAASLGELREVARGLHPAVVSAHGLEVALEQLAARAAVPVTLDVRVGARLPESLEVAAFYIVSESLANVGKYAQASGARVEVTRDDALVRVHIADDGVGGADESRGSGLRGLADRVEALGGTLRVWSPVGGGTRVVAEIPCAS
jgi:signal transduction histidine kinase